MRVPPPGSGAGRRLPHAGELFTDRESESKAFKKSLAEFRRQIERDDEAGVARRNVLAFYGLGGIGKTTLSERLDAWVGRRLPLVNGWGPPPPTKVDATARIDLHGSAGQLDLTGALIALRAGVGKFRKRWPVFDLAFTAYWSAVHPGESLPRFAAREDMDAAIGDIVKDVLSDVGSLADLAVGAGAGLAVRGARKLVGELRRRRDLNLAIGAFAGFEDFLLRCADEPGPTDPRPDLVCELAATLSWEIATREPGRVLVVFVDTTERLKLDPRRVAERHLNTLVHGMPNVLFVLTGRDVLDWHDETRTELPHRGPWTWPGLVPGAGGEPRQHLVGNLSPSDTRELIRLSRGQLDLPMSDEVVEELVTASRGLPQYIEVARQVAVSVKDSGQGRQVRASDVTGSLGSLVLRVLDDVPADEQRAIRAACLFRVFDTGLIAAAADVDHGCAERAVLRPMIDRHEGERFPYRMHDAVREAIRHTDFQVSGGWSDRDWRLAAARAVAAARELHDGAEHREDDDRLMSALAIAIGVVCDQETDIEPAGSPNYEDWLTRAIVFAPSIQGLRSRVPGASRTGYGRHVLDFISGKSIEVPLEERLRLLRSVFDSDHPLRLPAGRHLGYTLKVLRRWDEALAVFDEVVRLAPTRVNRRQGPLTLSLARRFEDARQCGGEVPDLVRLAEYAHGRPESYFAEIGEKIERLQTARRRREALEDRGDLLARRVFFHAEVGGQEVADLLAEGERVGHVLAIRNALLSTVLHHDADPTTISVALERLENLERASAAAGTIEFRYAIAEFCAAAIAGDRRRLEDLRTKVSQIGFRTRSWIPVECFFASVGLPLPETPTQWLEPPEEVGRRWTGHLDAYLARHGATREELRPH
ncbi:hypothetical protein [Amycolatopsis vastitatis]|uniref:ATP/GTP-binding protein n=1 Tax=Amycolatopsis vastitatis TaxID=1905142 RepID=A0A229T8N3_9PSEU|nr:hypothetical protein [Amycolatopsis vastitatis]OXM67370.1 hypothetical protein CF165_17035 [Amycolatopsis vastitatis]